MKNKEAGLQDIILISIKLISKSGEKASFSRLVKKSFELFPEQISLTDFPQYPDSLKLDRAWRSLRDKNLITGSPDSYFTLTKNGDLTAENLLKNMATLQHTGPSKFTTRSPSAKILERIRKSEHYKKFLKENTNFKFDEMRIRELLGFTLETPVKKVIGELDYLLKTSGKKTDKSLQDFLKYYKSNLKIEGKI